MSHKYTLLRPVLIILSLIGLIYLVLSNSITSLQALGWIVGWVLFDQVVFLIALWWWSSRS